MVVLLSTALMGNAQYKELNPQEKDLLRIHEKELRKNAQLITEELWLEKVTSYGIEPNSEDATKLFELIYERELRKQMRNIYLSENLEQRYKDKRNIDQEYEDSICRVMAPYWNMGLPNLYKAILYREGINLTDSQYRDIVTNMIRLKTKAERMSGNMWGDELEVLKEVLTGDQLDTYFRAKNARIATRDSRLAWQRLKDAGMTNDLDSAKTVARIFIHKLKILQATDLYWNDENKKREAWTAIDYYAPMEMRRVYSINRKNRAKKQGYKGSFNW